MVTGNRFSTSNDAPKGFGVVLPVIPMNYRASKHQNAKSALTARQQRQHTRSNDRNERPLFAD